MNTWLALALLLALLLLAACGTMLWRLRAQLRQIAADRSAPFKPGLITIDIRNSLQLAAQRSKIFGVVGSLSPELVRRLVQQETAKTLATELRARGVDAEVKIL